MEILRLVVPAHRLQAVVYRGLTCTPDDALTTGFVDELAAPNTLVERAVEVAAHLGSLPRALVLAHEADHSAAQPGPCGALHAIAGGRGSAGGVDVGPGAGCSPRVRRAHSSKVTGSQESRAFS